jgi:ABC-type multidrug transport system fused ATPase/permease subunit
VGREGRTPSRLLPDGTVLVVPHIPYMADKKLKVSRKDLADLSTTETLALARETYGKLFRYLKPYRGRFFGGILLSVFAGMSNAVLVQSLNAVFAAVLEKNAVTPEEMEKVQESFKLGIGAFSFNILDVLPPEWRGSQQLAIAACALVPCVFFLRAALTYLANYCMAWVGNRVLFDLRNAAYRSVINQSMSYFSKAKAGNLVQTVFNQSRVAQQNLVMLCQDIVQRPVAILSILALLFYLEPNFTFYSLVVFPLCLLPVILIGKRVRKAGAQEEAEAGHMLVQMTEAFQGIRVVKSHAREDHEAKRFMHSSMKTNQLVMRYQKAGELVGSIVEVVASLGVSIGLYYAYTYKIEVGMFFTLVAGLTQIYPHTKALSRLQLMMQKTIVATSAVFAMIEEKNDIMDAADAKAMGRSKGHLRLENVVFTYKTGRKDQAPAVQGITLDLEPGKFYALVGRSGSGKSTIFSLIQRFYDVDSGRITLDGEDIRSITQKSLRENISVVSQDNFLFHDTIMENIRYGRLTAKDAEVVAAAKKAHAHEFITEKKEGYDLTVGDGGSLLSGGQKQRITIARAVLRDAPILLLDEATSALDTETEKVIQEAVHNLSEGRTVIAIAHRLSTILEAHQIIVMNEGRIETMGTHAELLEKSPIYSQLYALQFQDAPETE